VKIKKIKKTIVIFAIQWIVFFSMLYIHYFLIFFLYMVCSWFQIPFQNLSDINFTKPNYNCSMKSKIKNLSYEKDASWKKKNKIKIVNNPNTMSWFKWKAKKYLVNKRMMRVKGRAPNKKIQIKNIYLRWLTVHIYNVSKLNILIFPLIIII